MQVGVRPDSFANLRHALERILAHIKERGLKPGASAELEVADAGRSRGLDGGEDIIQSRLASEDTLETVAERGEHHPDFFFLFSEDH